MASAASVSAAEQSQTQTQTVESAPPRAPAAVSASARLRRVDARLLKPETAASLARTAALSDDEFAAGQSRTRARLLASSSSSCDADAADADNVEGNDGTSALPLVLWSSMLDCAETHFAGGKGASLCVLDAVRSVRVPRFFVVSTAAFRRCVAQNPAVRPLVDEMQAVDTSVDTRAVAAVAQQLRKCVRSLTLPADIDAAIANAYDELARREGIPDVSVAVRSSATTEDLECASFAGQHSTYLNQVGRTDVVKAVRACWASVFNTRACEYRNRLGIPHRRALVAVVVQKMVFPVAAGTGFSVEIGTTFPGLHVAASFGLGESLVSGEVTSDEWLFDRSSLRLIKRTRGSKRIQYSINAERSGVSVVPVDRARARTYCLAPETAREVAAATRDIAEAYQQMFGYEHMDTEFAVSATPTLYFLQARPVVPVVWTDVQTVASDVAKNGDVLLRGKYALVGAVHGRVRLIEHFEDLSAGRVSIGADDIVVAAKTGNYWNQFLQHFKGIVTVEGSPTAHPMLIGRERGLPCVIGCPDALERLRPFDRQWVTLDGLRKCVYRGRLPLVAATERDMQARFGPAHAAALPSDEESERFLLQAGRAFRDDDGVLWVANPDHALSPSWCALTAGSYALRHGIIAQSLGRCAASPASAAGRSSLELSREYLVDRTLERGHKVYDEMQPLQDTLAVFGGMGLEECVRYVELRAAACAEYLAACGAFAAHPALESWRAYCDAYRLMVAHKWLSWFFRMFVELRGLHAARAAACSQMHLDAMQERFQAEMQPEDLDVALFRELGAASRAFRAACAAGVSVADLEKDHSDAYTCVGRLCAEFKITKSTDIAAEPPLEEMWRKVQERAADVAGGAGPSPSEETAAAVETVKKDGAAAAEKKEEKKQQEEEEFFPDNQDFVAWVHLGIRARIQHCNGHHLLVRGQWKVRSALLRVAPRAGVDPPSSVFQLSLPELDSMIARFEKAEAEGSPRSS